MKPRSLRFHPKALADLEEADRYYAAISLPLAMRFLEAVEECIGYLLQFPGGFPMVRDPIRQVPMNDFSFLVIYAWVEQEIIVLRVFPTAKDPSGQLI